MAAEYSITLTLGYADTDQVRAMKFTDVSATYATENSVATKVKAINDSIEGGTAGGLSEFFLSDNGDNFMGIVAAKIDAVEETTLNITD